MQQQQQQTQQQQQQTQQQTQQQQTQHSRRSSRRSAISGAGGAPFLGALPPKKDYAIMCEATRAKCPPKPALCDERGGQRRRRAKILCGASGAPRGVLAVVCGM
jgi:hypothetical protein